MVTYLLVSHIGQMLSINLDTKLILSFVELHAGVCGGWGGMWWGWRPTSSCQTAPGSLELDLAVDGNWTQECTDWNLDQDSRQDKEQGPLQKLTMDEENKTLVIPQF